VNSPKKKLSLWVFKSSSFYGENFAWLLIFYLTFFSIQFLCYVVFVGAFQTAVSQYCPETPWSVFYKLYPFSTSLPECLLHVILLSSYKICMASLRHLIDASFLNSLCIFFFSNFLARFQTFFVSFLFRGKRRNFSSSRGYWLKNLKFKAWSLNILYVFTFELKNPYTPASSSWILTIFICFPI
jgi:hypothetical protein